MPRSILRRLFWLVATALGSTGLLWLVRSWPLRLTFEGLYDLGVIALLLAASLAIAKALHETA